ncbi:ATP synthase protein I [Chitinivorax tropicus]|uniref:ATP synthase protein I n=1 Tax=Chitinivorax tropicus TaxID=714531 RepID=A0A840MFN2_9PROT|nr:ATP synthase subunit I [Chitinivorax tropicus]MBB5018064.1 ATP synthase protein I [Chitinivorax tropicus]
MNRQVSRVISLQIFFVSLLAVILWWQAGKVVALSSLAGGAIGVISSLVYAVVANGDRHRAPQVIIKAHFAAEMLKFTAVVIMFALAVIFLRNELSAPALFGGYLATTLGYWAALMFKN